MIPQDQRRGVAASERLIGAVVNNPEGLLLVAAGCALLMRTTTARLGRGYRAGERFQSDDRRGGVQRRASFAEAADTVREYAADVGERLTETASSYASSASASAQEARRAVTDTSERVITNAQSAFQDTANRIVQEQPLTLAILGLAAGAAVAAVLPPSDMERETLGPAGERLADAAERVGETLKDSTAKAGERLKDAAQTGLKEAATDVAEAVGDALSGEQEESTRSSSESTSISNRGASASSTVGLSGGGAMGTAMPAAGMDRSKTEPPASGGQSDFSGRSGNRPSGRKGS